MSAHVSTLQPDILTRQIRILQGALKLLLTSESGSVPLDIMTEGSVPNAKPLPMKDFPGLRTYFFFLVFESGV